MILGIWRKVEDNSDEAYGLACWKAEFGKGTGFISVERDRDGGAYTAEWRPYGAQRVERDFRFPGGPVGSANAFAAAKQWVLEQAGEVRRMNPRRRPRRGCGFGASE